VGSYPFLNEIVVLSPLKKLAFSGGLFKKNGYCSMFTILLMIEGFLILCKDLK
jgi:hypothetical protein